MTLCAGVHLARKLRGNPTTFGTLRMLTIEAFGMDSDFSMEDFKGVIGRLEDSGLLKLAGTDRRGLAGISGSSLVNYPVKFDLQLEDVDSALENTVIKDNFYKRTMSPALLPGCVLSKSDGDNNNTAATATVPTNIDDGRDIHNKNYLLSIPPSSSSLLVSNAMVVTAAALAAEKQYQQQRLQQEKPPDADADADAEARYLSLSDVSNTVLPESLFDSILKNSEDNKDNDNGDSSSDYDNKELKDSSSTTIATTTTTTAAAAAAAAAADDEDIDHGMIDSNYKDSNNLNCSVDKVLFLFCRRWFLTHLPSSRSLLYVCGGLAP